MAQYYELVVYTDQLPTYADPILDRLDPQRFIQYRLYRDSTHYINGKHVSPFTLLEESSLSTATSASMPAPCMAATLKGLSMGCCCAILPMFIALCLTLQVRNLNYLNRDLDKVLFITANPDAHALQPDNAVKVCLLHALLVMLTVPWHALLPVL